MEERVFAFVASACLLLWLLARERRLPPGLRRAMELAAYVGLAVGLVVAIVASVGHFLG